MCGIISQYILPLLDQSGNILGVMQVDLGDLRKPRRLHFPVKNVLETIASAVAASIARLVASETARVVAGLDLASNRALNCETLEQAMQIYIEAAIAAFQATGGHVRLWDVSENKLRLAAGSGP